ncbi:MAG: hypothetical protein ACJAR1_001139 [Rubritalea sp.]|jgi:hypothetical protein|tara:strand:- start:5358 stop:5528 length:171 start_codon:yes stop_codon:yes gene_type:complete
MREHFVSTLKLDPKHRASQNNFNDTFDLDRLIFTLINDFPLERASSAFSSGWSSSS